MNNKVLAIIPARAGSKGVVNKNRRLIKGRPLIEYTIDAVIKSKRVTDVVVSTDDVKIIEIACRKGIQVIQRPQDLAGDHSPVIDTIKHVLVQLVSSVNSYPTAIILLQPTSPLRVPSDIDSSIDLYFNHNCIPVCSVVRCEDAHPARMYTLDKDGRLSSLMPDIADCRRQDLPEVFLRNGAIYVFGKQEVDNGKIINTKMVPYVMDHKRSVNIDTEFDLILAEQLLAQE